MLQYRKRGKPATWTLAQRKNGGPKVPMGGQVRLGSSGFALLTALGAVGDGRSSVAVCSQ